MWNGKKFVFSALAGMVLLGGCATNTAVDQRISALEGRTSQKIESVEGQIEDLQEQQRATNQRLDQVSREAQEALRRADEAGVLAKGQVVFEQAFTDDTIRFNLESSELTDEAKAGLDQLAGRIKALDRPVFIEIQGHTDSTGPARYNEDLGYARAEAVRRYLNQQHDLPLARMSTISYGESMPSADNSTRQGRMQNRRVVIVVLE
ncbi:MAG TPA: OmpA family protein [Thermoanaerobaculia bacterium]|nr:OmpA family protein [Thermoanaerobaculia bacterium]